VLITLVEATPNDLPCIENMMQFYNYDLSESLPIEFAAHGLYQIQPKSAYWAQFLVAAFLIKVDGALAGFAVVDKELLETDSQYNMGYFFVARRHRGQGVARLAVEQLLAKFPGHWEIYYLKSNRPAAKFWHIALPLMDVGELLESERYIHGEFCTLFRFKSL
jgi:predicted acetyltransferase